MEYFIAKALIVLKIIGFPIAFVFFGKTFAQYSEWFNEHYTDLASYSVCGVVLYTHHLPLFGVTPIGVFVGSCLSLLFKTAIGVSVTYFVNKALKKNFPTKDKKNVSDKDTES